MFFFANFDDCIIRNVTPNFFLCVYVKFAGRGDSNLKKALLKETVFSDYEPACLVGGQ